MEKIKHFLESEKGKDILVVIIVILVGLGSFELGRLSKENTFQGLKIEYPAQNGEIIQANTQTAVSAISGGKNFFASSRGTKYYTISCSAGKTIKQENRVWFATSEEAEQAGYTLSSSCN
jgi:hypothetical protein